MRIALVSASLTSRAGGLYDSLLGMSQELAKLPDTGAFVFGLQDGDLEDDLAQWKPLPVESFPVRGSKAFGFAPQLARRLVGSQLDLAHTHGLWQYPSVAVSNWHGQTRKPYLVSPHGMLDPWAIHNSKWKKRIAAVLYEQKHLERAACLHSLCEAEAQAIRAYGLKNPVCVIPNGVDLPEASETQKAEGRRQKGNMTSTFNFQLSTLAASGRKVLLYLGRLHPKKGLTNLIQAWAGIQKESEVRSPKSEEWVLAIAGWDQAGHEAELKRLATELGIEWEDIRDLGSAGGSPAAFGVPPDALQSSPAHSPDSSERRQCRASNIQHLTSNEASLLFLGPQFGDDKRACYRNCDAFILPSFSEGLPMVVLEAWAYGKPVLMTPQCNVPEGFENDAAVRIEPEITSIARGLHELLRMSDSELAEMGGHGRKLVTSRFAWPQVAQDMRAVYEWVLGGGSKPACVLS